MGKDNVNKGPGYETGKIEDLGKVLKDYRYRPGDFVTMNYPVDAVRVLREALVEIKAIAMTATCIDTFTTIEDIAKKALEETK